MYKTWVCSVLLGVGFAAALHAGAPDEGRSLSEWVNILASADAAQRLEAAQALGDMGTEAGSAAGALAGLLGDPATSVRQKAAWALGQLGPGAVVAVPQLGQALKDPDWEVRGMAAHALTKVGPAASAAVPQLKAALNDPNDLARSAMAGALWQTSGDGTEALPVLLALLRSQDPRSRRYAVLTFDLLGPTAAPALASVLTALSDEDPSVRGAAARALGKLGVDNPQVRSALENALSDGDEDVREEAQASLQGLTGIIMAAEAPGTAPRTVPQAGSDVTAFLDPLRAHKQALTALKTRLQKMQNQPKPTTAQQAQQWAEDAVTLGRDIRTGGQAFQGTLHDFTHARTRAGLIEELELARSGMDLFGALTDQYMILIKADHAAFQQSLKDAMIAELRTYLIFRARGKAIEKLQKFGVEDILNSTSWAEAHQQTVARLQTEINTRIEQKTEEVFGLQFHNAATARFAVRQRVHQEVDKQVARLLMKFTGNSLILEFAGGMIVRWLENDLWPRLREAFRNKDDLRERVDRSKETMYEARDRLFALTPQANIEQVKEALRKSEGTVYASRYLVQDLTAAREQALLDELQIAVGDLKRLIDLTSQRFLLGKRDALEELGGEEEVLKGMLAAQNRLIGLVKAPAVQAPGPGTTAAGVRKPTLVTFAGPLFLVHIIETSTMYGPVKKDAWILHPKQPENNTLLTADETGGYFVNKTDRVLGPFASNYEVGPALVANRIGGVWYGQTFISGDPKYWE